MVLAAVMQTGVALAAASAELKADKAVVLAAVAQDGSALGFAAAVLKADKEVGRRHAHTPHKRQTRIPKTPETQNPQILF